jgi:hypothetical protein
VTSTRPPADALEIKEWLIDGGNSFHDGINTTASTGRRRVTSSRSPFHFALEKQAKTRDT